MGSVIMLSGPVGAGKTTVARELIALLPGPISYIEGDTFWSFIAKAEKRARRENFPVIMRAMQDLGATQTCRIPQVWVASSLRETK